MTPIREKIQAKAEALKNEECALEKTHEEAALSWNGANFWLKTAAPVATAVLSLITLASGTGTTISAVLHNFTGSLFGGIATIVLSLLVTIISTLTATHKPGERGEQHEKAKYDFAELKEKIEYFSTFAIAKETVSDDILEEQLKDLSMQKINLGRKNVALPSRMQQKGFMSWLFYKRATQ